MDFDSKFEEEEEIIEPTMRLTCTLSSVIRVVYGYETKREFPDSYSDPARAYSAMSDLQSRRNTYKGATNISPSKLSEAGFFRPGDSDIRKIRGRKEDYVKCFCCGGGLQDWNSGDDPWIEHAKYFPTCEFLLREKGQKFVLEILSQYPFIHRPTILGQEKTLHSQSHTKISDVFSSNMSSKSLDFLTDCGNICEKNKFEPNFMRNGAIDEENKLSFAGGGEWMNAADQIMEDILTDCGNICEKNKFEPNFMRNGAIDEENKLSFAGRGEWMKAADQIREVWSNMNYEFTGNGNVQTASGGGSNDSIGHFSESDPSFVQQGQMGCRPEYQATTGNKVTRINDSFTDDSFLSGTYNILSNRRQTFASFPMDCPIVPDILVKAGFVYSGYHDRVKCYYCRRIVEHWGPNEDPSEEKWHRPGCARSIQENSHQERIDNVVPDDFTDVENIMEEAGAIQGDLLYLDEKNNEGTIPMKAYENPDPFQLSNIGLAISVFPEFNWHLNSTDKSQSDVELPSVASDRALSMGPSSNFSLILGETASLASTLGNNYQLSRLVVWGKGLIVVLSPLLLLSIINKKPPAPVHRQARISPELLRVLRTSVYNFGAIMANYFFDTFNHCDRNLCNDTVLSFLLEYGG